MINPNYITFLRIICAIALTVLYICGCKNYGILLFGVAAFSDFLDGIYARRTNQTSAFGAYLDAFADKLLIVSTSMILLYIHAVTGVHTLPVFLIAWRELFVSSIRHLPSSTPVPSHRLKTAMQMLAYILLLWENAPSTPTLIILWSSCALSYAGINKYWKKLEFFN